MSPGSAPWTEISSLPPRVKIFFLIIVGSFVLAAIATWRRSQARKDALRRMGFREIGTDVFPGGAFTVDTLLGEHAGSSRHRLKWAARGETSGGETILFDAVFGLYVHSDDVEDEDRNTMVAFRVPAEMPAFLMRHLNAGNRNEVRGRRPIAFEGRASFNERYSVMASDDAVLRKELGPDAVEAEDGKWGLRRRLYDEDPARQEANDEAVRRLFTPAALDLLEADGDKRLRVEKDGEWLFVYRYRRVLKPAAYQGFVREAAQLVEALDFRS